MSHFSAGIQQRIDGGVREYLVVWSYRSLEDLRSEQLLPAHRRTKGRMKFPGGTNKEARFRRETVYDTLNREVCDETGYIPPPRPIRIWVSQPKRDVGGTWHTQHFFWWSEGMKGSIHTHPVRDGDEWLLAEWADEESVDKCLMDTHRPAFRELKRIRRMFPHRY